MPTHVFFHQRFASLVLAASITLYPATTWAVALPDPHTPDANVSITNGMVNQTYSSLQAGKVYNTPDGITTFQNSSSLHLTSGTLHGFEVVTQGQGFATSGNGGAIQIIAPIVRLDGNIDVSGFLKGNQMGNGGSVRIEATYLYQNGAIYANGAKGGMVQINVGAMSGNGNIEANSTTPGGNGGVIAINGSKQTLTKAQLSIYDLNGQLIGQMDPSIISVKGDIVNFNGIHTATGIAYSANGADAGKNGKGGNGGSISLISNTGPVINEATLTANAGNGKTPGTLGLVVVEGVTPVEEPPIIVENPPLEDPGHGQQNNEDHGQSNNEQSNSENNSSSENHEQDEQNQSDEHGNQDQEQGPSGDHNDDGHPDNGQVKDDTPGSDNTDNQDNDPEVGNEPSDDQDHNDDGHPDNGQGPPSDPGNDPDQGPSGDHNDDGHPDNGQSNNPPVDPGPSGDHNNDGHPDNGKPPFVIVIEPPVIVEEPLTVEEGSTAQTEDSSPLNNFLGLFQHGRPIPAANGSPASGTLLSLGKPNMFLFRTYIGVTQQILQNALKRYNDAKLAGLSDAEATEQAIKFLIESGMDKEIAGLLLQQIDDGTLVVDAPVQHALEVMIQ